MKFYSQEWLDEVKDRSTKDEDYMKKAKGLTAKARNILTDCPGGVDVMIEIHLEDGKVVKAVHSEKPAPSDFRKLGADPEYLSVASGTYEAWAKLNKREITVMQALATKVYKIHADMGKLMKLMEKFTALTDLERGIPCEY